MGKGYDARTANAANVEERKRWTREDLRQMLFEAHDAMIDAALRLDESHLPVLDYIVPMGPEYDLRVSDFLWRGWHDRQHADDIRRALETDWQPQELTFAPELERKMRWVALWDDAGAEPLYGGDAGRGGAACQRDRASERVRQGLVTAHFDSCGSAGEWE